LPIVAEFAFTESVEDDSDEDDESEQDDESKKWAKRNTYFSPQTVSPVEVTGVNSDSAFQLVKKVWGKLFKNREYGAPETTLHLSWSINRISPASLHNEFLGIFARVLYGILLFTESSITLSRIKYHIEQNQVRASVWKARLQRSALCKFVRTN
jgi:hypothetical protein